MLLLREFIAPSQFCFEMPRLVHHWHRHNLLALCHFVNVVVLEAAVLIEVDVLELTLSDYLVGDFALEVHEQFQHVVVGLAGKHDFTCKEFIYCCSTSPEINHKVILHTQNYFGCSVKPGNKVGRNLAFCNVGGGPKVA